MPAMLTDKLHVLVTDFSLFLFNVIGRQINILGTVLLIEMQSAAASPHRARQGRWTTTLRFFLALGCFALRPRFLLPVILIQPPRFRSTALDHFFIAYDRPSMVRPSARLRRDQNAMHPQSLHQGSGQSTKEEGREQSTAHAAASCSTHPEAEEDGNLTREKALLAEVGSRSKSQAEPILRRALEESERSHGSGHPDTLSILNRLAACIDDQGRHSKAEPLFRQAVEIQKRANGPEHPDTLNGLNKLAICMAEQGRHARAEPLFRQALEGRKQALGPDHPDTLSSINKLASCLQEQGRSAEAAVLFRQVLEAKKRGGHPDVGEAAFNLGAVLEAVGRKDEAKEMFLQAKGVFEKAYGADHAKTRDAASAVQELIAAIEEED